MERKVEVGGERDGERVPDLSVENQVVRLVNIKLRRRPQLFTGADTKSILTRIARKDQYLAAEFSTYLIFHNVSICLGFSLTSKP